MAENTENTELIKDALGEIANVAGGISTTALDNLFSNEIRLNIMGQKLDTSLNMTDFMSLADLNKLMVEKKEVILISSPIRTKEMEGDITLTFSFESALFMTSMFEQKKGFYEMLSEEDQITLKRIGQILLDSYLSAFSTFLELPTTHAESKLYVMSADKVITFLRERVDKRLQNTIIFETKYAIPRTQMSGTFQLMFSLKDLSYVVKSVEKKLGLGVDDSGIKQTDYLRIEGKEIKNVDDLSAFLKGTSDDVVAKYIVDSKNIFADWMARIYKDEDIGNRLRLRRSRADLLSALEKEKIKISQASEEKDKEKKFDDTISVLKEEYASLKKSLSDLRKIGKNVTFIEMSVERIPSKIKLVEATKSLEDVQKIQNMIGEIKKEIATI